MTLAKSSLFTVITTTILILINSSCDRAEPEAKSRRVQFTYNVEVPVSEPAERIDIWIPMPRNNRHQELADYHLFTELRHEVVTDTVFGNRLLHLFADKPSENQSVALTFNITRRELISGQLTTPPEPATGWDAPENYLAPNRLVPIDGAIAAEADSVLDGVGTVREKAATLFNHLLRTMRYDKSGEGWGRGDALFACDVRRGNCTDIHSLFIGMARAAGIPARFKMGFPLPPDNESGEIKGYHCWAEFHDPERGWTPVDISEAIKHQERKDYLFGNLDFDRVEFTMGRDIPIDVPDGVAMLNYLIYPYVLVDGRPSDRYEKSFSFKNL